MIGYESNTDEKKYLNWSPIGQKKDQEFKLLFITDILSKMFDYNCNQILELDKNKWSKVASDVSTGTTFAGVIFTILKPEGAVAKAVVDITTYIGGAATAYTLYSADKSKCKDLKNKLSKAYDESIAANNGQINIMIMNLDYYAMGYGDLDSINIWSWNEKYINKYCLPDNVWDDYGQLGSLFGICRCKVEAYK